MQRCWAGNPARRPRAGDVARLLSEERILSPSGSSWGNAVASKGSAASTFVTADEMAEAMVAAGTTTSSQDSALPSNPFLGEFKFSNFESFFLSHDVFRTKGGLHLKRNELL